MQETQSPNSLLEKLGLDIRFIAVLIVRLNGSQQNFEPVWQKGRLLAKDSKG
jgi:hypothetical protein